MVKSYRTKPCEIKAIQFTRDSFEEVKGFTEGCAFNLFEDVNNVCFCAIETLEGTMIATEGDYIIKGLRGEFYPCKPDVFIKKYEEID